MLDSIGIAKKINARFISVQVCEWNRRSGKENKYRTIRISIKQLKHG